MTDPDRTARTRYFAMTLTRIAGAAGAVLGVLLLARATDTTTRILGVAIVLAALYMIATVPRALARKWRTPKP
ncbi:hypothetical protein [Stakelama saccharophila]|uniref:Major facilitator superfamily (MFS) profile domain-containing protein n=1 Tax=Stakelama saccharophila TaxID=3075605 RepID=A0ABZ0BBG3_9SPHN|nr:hypothetical protein [Stakelama sp. W311]WNO54542.1 hypothetical protein RPR59_04615 [Stakelama sp. W311]